MAKNPASAKNGELGGRPKGRLNNKTLERQAILKQMQQRIMGIVDSLLDSQITLARGVSYLYKIEKYWKKFGKQRVLVRKEPKRVTDEEEIREYLVGLLPESDLHDESPEATYYFITTEKPDGRAIEALWNRTFGRNVQPVALTDTEGNDIIDNDSKAKAKKVLAGFLAGGGNGHPRARRKERG